MDYNDPNHLLAAAKKLRAEFLQQVRTTSVSDAQAATLRDDPVKGPLWVAKFTVPKPTEDTSRELLLSLVDDLNDRNIFYDRPDSQPLQFEWVGYRHNVEKNTPEPSISESEKFQRLVAETKQPTVIFYIYGGTFVLNTPSCYRRTTGFLAQETGSKVLMVHQRLAPQSPFPSALLDVFQAYLALLAPPPGALHKAVSPSSIVIAGDSSGTCLAFGLLQVLLRLQRSKKTIVFHGQTIDPTVPAGLALVSPIADQTGCLPSYERNVKTDIHPVPMENLHYLQPDFPTCALWPTRPPRSNLYCDGALLAHPLVSPVASEDWTGSCPIWMASGEEQATDPARLIAQVANSQGVSVTYDEYEKMPHTFFFFYRQAPQTAKIMADWAQAILGFCVGERPTSCVRYIRAKGLVAEPQDMNQLVPFTVAEVRELMWEKNRKMKVPPFHRDPRSMI
ncbi:alpha/beta-hydrolase [Aspergillus steynii IBT 23096]|uniref:Alpha/beta-hydrolase n=1 Tax=Aspergillus steynii IBT 23096 TaxID=1392250 RepID=A0A2I2G741_9EURO|nr:alpha/beta-hydrolase [Aspergillus steynii IBT 23096]PLB48690.1 alpha/beta-hydrolase [Aspergillus steynii IBT 23096]